MAMTQTATAVATVETCSPIGREGGRARKEREEMEVSVGERRGEREELGEGRGERKGGRKRVSHEETLS